MITIRIDIDFNDISTHEQLVNLLSPGFYAKKEINEVFISINLNLNNRKILYADYLLLINCLVNFLRENNIRVGGEFLNFTNNASVKYASRINFFKHLDFKYQEDFVRQNGVGKFIEISKFDKNNANHIHDAIMLMIENQGVNEDMLIVLMHCTWEILDNTLNHSFGDFKLGNGTGYVCGQFFPGKKEIRIMIADTGIGIHKALTEYPGSKYPYYTEPEAVSQCIAKGVTNGSGKGMGLWLTSEMVRKNTGQMIVHSGNSAIDCANESMFVNVSTWNGAYTFINIKTDIPVYHKDLLGDSSEWEDGFAFHMERIKNAKQIKELW